MFLLFKASCLGDDCSSSAYTVTVGDEIFAVLVVIPVLLVIGVIVVIICVKRRQRENKHIDHRIEM